MSRTLTIFLLGAAALLVGCGAALLSHGNTAFAGRLAERVHHQDDLRIEIDAVKQRILERSSALRTEFERAEGATLGKNVEALRKNTLEREGAL